MAGDLSLTEDTDVGLSILSIDLEYVKEIALVIIPLGFGMPLLMGRVTVVQ